MFFDIRFGRSELSYLRYLNKRINQDFGQLVSDGMHSRTTGDRPVLTGPICLVLPTLSKLPGYNSFTIHTSENEHEKKSDALQAGTSSQFKQIEEGSYLILPTHVIPICRTSSFTPLRDVVFRRKRNNCCRSWNGKVIGRLT